MFLITTLIKSLRTMNLEQVEPLKLHPVRQFK